MKRNDGPAFPDPGDQYWGLTKRQWFAGQAIKNLVSNMSVESAREAAKEWAEIAFIVADAMLTEDQKEEGK